MAGKIALTGIQPSGDLHLGNYLGAIRPALELVDNYDAYYFIADGHALTTVLNADELRRQTYEAAATWIALGLDPSRVVIYRQSDIPEVFELSWVLSCVTPKGLLNRAHKYKDVVDENAAAGRTPDDGVSIGLFNYPVLMAADILIVGANVVPVGADNKQHLEIARDIAEAFNRTFGETLVVPEFHGQASDSIITGSDGRKMSKSYGNVIPIFAPPEAQAKMVMRIVTDSRPPEEPKDPATDNVFRLYQHFASPSDVEAMRARYTKGGVGYAEVKRELAALLEKNFAEPRARYEELLADRSAIDKILSDGAERAREVTREVLMRVKRAVGL